MDGVQIAAIIAASCTGVAAIIGAFKVQGSAEKKATKEAERDDPADRELPPVPTTLDPDQVLAFLAEVREDNGDLRRINGENSRRIAAQQTQLDDMAGELRLALKIQEAFMRWIPVIFRNWGKTATPPLPEGEDLITLQEFIPRG